ncbi:hypothetical protein J5A59_07290 [Prevotella nigrescens]|nr:hypothetical protein [Prevotella nigrescens]QUB51148.1 hypothetical protein J5A59_07290 [Prevotella nigrescens]
MTAFWNYFIYFAMVAVLLWAAGACAAWKDRKVVAYSATIAGLVVFFSYILIVNFVLLQMCWWGINYLPSAQGTSVHTYNMQ